MKKFFMKYSLNGTCLKIVNENISMVTVPKIVKK